MKRTNRYTTTVEEHIQEKTTNYPKKKKMANPRSEHLENFKVLDDDTEVYLYDNGEPVEFIDFPRVINLIDIILRVLDTNLLDKLIESNIEHTKSTELPSLFHSPKENSRRKDYTLERRKIVLKYYATRLLIMSSHKPKLRSNWPLEFPGGKYVPMGSEMFQKMLSNFLIRLDCVKAINSKFNSIVKTGRHVVWMKNIKDHQKIITWPDGSMEKSQIGVIGTLNSVLLAQTHCDMYDAPNFYPS